MEYCVVEGKVTPMFSSNIQRHDFREVQNLKIFAIHDGRVGRDQPVLSRVFELRATRLVPYIVDALKVNFSPENIKIALGSAFKRMDGEVSECMNSYKDFNWERFRVHQQTSLNSLVVIIHDRWIYVAGCASARVVLCRDFKPVYLQSYQCKWRLEPTRVVEDPELFFFRKEQVQDNDAYVTIASTIIFNYLLEMFCLLPVLQTRIDAVGLVEACKSVVGRYEDASKILIVVTLQKDAHLPLHSGVQRKPMVIDERCVGPVKRTRKRSYLLPWVDGIKQDPEPQTSYRYFEFGEILPLCDEGDIRVSSSLGLQAK